jgi:glycosyltransferase involved in cell wall biosynthesis
MRIAIDVSPLAAPWGGIRRYTEQILRGLSRVDCENEYALYGIPEGDDERDVLGLGDNFEPSSSGVPTRLRLRLPVSCRPVDLVHGTNYWFPYLERAPAVLTVHDLTVQLFTHHHPRRRRLLHRMLPSFCRRAVRIIADSQSTKRDLVRYLGVPEEKIRVVYLAAGGEFRPVGDDLVLDPVRERYSLPDRYMLFLGSIEPRKNLPILVEALRELRREGRPQSLVIAGGGERGYVEYLRQLIARTGLLDDGGCVLTGPVADADLPALYSMADAYVYPSVYEGFGLPPLEAMACGVPVVLPGNSSLGELYRDCSAVTEADPASLVEGLRRLLDDSDYRGNLVARGFERARSRTWEDTAAETLEVYRVACAAA